MTGRPTIRTEAIIDAILNRVTKGEPLAQVLRTDGMPGVTAFYDWLNTDKQLSDRFARAREFGADAIAVSALEILDEPPRMVDTKYGEQVDSGDVALRRARFDGRLKLLSKWDRRYAERQQIEHSGKLSLESLVADPDQSDQPE